MNAYRVVSVGIAFVLGGCVFCPPETCDDYDLDEWCDLVALNEPDPNSRELDGILAMCGLWWDGKITESQWMEFCFLDDESKATIMDVAEYCTLQTDAEFEGDFQTAVQEWRSMVEADGCDSPVAYIASLYTGECADGKVFISQSGPFTGTVTFYDAESGSFLARTAWGDFIVPPCCGVLHWPGRTDCPDAIVTEVICGGAVEAGEQIDFP